MDEKDELLLKALERNARASVVDLARRIGLSRSATQDRMMKLETSGAIAAYTVRRGIVSDKLGVKAFLTVRHRPGNNCKNNVPSLEKIPQVRSVYGVAGDTDLIVELHANDMSEIETVTQHIRNLTGIDHIISHMVLKTYFEHRPSE